jgi:hypothetical protein
VTHSNRNFVFAYMLLVALPLFGLAGILRSGRKLSAPISIGGVWKINTSPDQLAAFPCRQLLAENATFTISQSGRAFTLSLSNPASSATAGAIDGNTINATLIPAAVGAQDAGCGEPLSLTAIVDSKAKPRSFEGALRAENCSGCAALEFRGIREEQAKAKESH